MKAPKSGARAGSKANAKVVRKRATSVASEWGIPDWRDPASYGDSKEWSLGRWRWEFARRRPDVREFFDQWAGSAFADNQPSKLTPPNRSTPKGRSPGESGFMVECIGEEPWHLGMKFVPNPRLGGQPHYQFFFDPMRSITTGWRDVREVNDPVEVVLNFRLDRPLEPQLKEARQYLQISQRANCGQLLQKRRQPKKWLLYLRTLDADDAGASWRDIAQALLPGREDEAGEAASASEQKARDTWEAADALRFNF